MCQIEPDINYYRSFERLFDLPSVCNNISTEVSEGCTEQFMEICKNKTLLFSIYDANSKFPYTGLYEGSRVDFGSYDQCLAIDHQYDNGRILGKYCYSGLTIPDVNILNFLGYFKLSVCRPNNCSDNDYKLMFNYPLFIDGTCETKEDLPKVTTYDIITTVVFGVILSLMCLSTIYDMILRKNQQKAHHPVLLAFSVQSNWEKLVKVTEQSNKEQVLVLNGLKVFSMMWVLFGHTSGVWFLNTNLVKNIDTLLNMSSQLYEFYAFDAPFAVDTFFFISGFLMAWSYMKMKSMPLKTQIINIPIGYLYRYIRLTPAVVALLIAVMSVYKHLGSGPFWSTASEPFLSVSCREYWWSTLLYIQNYNNYDKMCLMHTWYLSADMQMFVLAPLVVIPLVVALRNPKRLIPCMIVMILLNGVLTGVPIWMRMANRDTKNIFATHTRLVNYCFGIMIATFMRETKDQPFFGSKLSEKSKWYLNLAIWCITLSGFTGLLLGTRKVEMRNEYEEYWTFDMIKRFIWSIILSWIIYSCHHGYGGIINYILSTPIMQFGAKISYSMYLVHIFVIYHNIGVSRTMFYISDYSLFLYFGSMLCVTIIVSIIWTLSFELPFLVIQTCLLRPVRAKKT